MEKNSNTTKIIIMGLIVVLVFVSVLSLNLLPNYESNSYFGKVDNSEMSAKIDSFVIKNNNVIIKTIGEDSKICVKTTRTTPGKKSLCWKDVFNNEISISVIKDEKYYVWIMDDSYKISNYEILK